MKRSLQEQDRFSKNMPGHSILTEFRMHTATPGALNRATKTSIIQKLAGDMSVFRSWAPILLLMPLSLWAGGGEGQTARPTSSASMEIGIDSLERAFIRPRFRYDFPLSFTSLYLDVDYTQRLNSRLQGEIDFWVRVGSVTKVSEFLDFEFSLNHFCRHKTSIDYPRVLDINELLGRIWPAFRPWIWASEADLTWGAATLTRRS